MSTWIPAKDEFSIFVEDANTGRILADVRSNGMTMEEHWARAKLIAAAPAMLEFLIHEEKHARLSAEMSEAHKQRHLRISALIAAATLKEGE